jgi:hypothetical protein
MGSAMPDIIVSDGHVDRNWIHALMNYPCDEKMRQANYATLCALGDLEQYPTDSLVAIDRGTLEQITSAARSSGLRESNATAFKRGTIAGYLLLALYVMDLFPDRFKIASVSRAIDFIRHFSQTTEYGNGDKLPKSASEIRECFNEFKSVAHLWAAWTLLKELPIPANPGMFGSEQAAIHFLGVAGGLQDFGISFKPPAPKGGESLLEEHDIWRVPDEVERLYPPLKRPPMWMLSATKKYKARARG